MVVVVMDESEDLASNSPPREVVLTSPGSLSLFELFELCAHYTTGWEQDTRDDLTLSPRYLLSCSVSPRSHLHLFCIY